MLINVAYSELPTAVRTTCKIVFSKHEFNMCLHTHIIITLKKLYHILLKSHKKQGSGCQNWIKGRVKLVRCF